MRKELIIKTYSNLKSYASVARLFGISRQRVHQIVKKYQNFGTKSRLKKYKKKLIGKKCAICKKVSATILHHKDFNNKNDAVDNLQPVCKDCHILLHNVFRNGQGRGKKYKKCKDCKKEFNINFKHHGEGLCRSCWQTKHRRENGVLERIKHIYCKDCKRKFTKEIKHCSRGLCKNCYEKRCYHENPQRREYLKEYQKKHHHYKNSVKLA